MTGLDIFRTWVGEKPGQDGRLSGGMMRAALTVTSRRESPPLRL
ncbi:hypothetical protein [Pendulispora brunnea]